MKVLVISILISASFCEGWNVTARSYGLKYHQDYEPYRDVTAVAEHEIPETYYTRVRPDKGLDLTNLGILALIKLLLFKAKGVGLGLVLLLKLPILFFLFVGKLMVVFKAFKFVKLLAMPFMLLGVLPFLLGPLMLLAPLLLPLLLFLPIPVLAPNTTTPMPAAGRKRRSTENAVNLIKTVLESEQCIERIACQLAESKDPLYNSAMAWSLERMIPYLDHPKLSAYLAAYKSSSKRKYHSQTCAERYLCTNRQLN